MSGYYNMYAIAEHLPSGDGRCINCGGQEAPGDWSLCPLCAAQDISDQRYREKKEREKEEKEENE